MIPKYKNNYGVLYSGIPVRFIPPTPGRSFLAEHQQNTSPPVQNGSVFSFEGTLFMGWHKGKPIHYF